MSRDNKYTKYERIAAKDDTCLENIEETKNVESNKTVEVVEVEAFEMKTEQSQNTIAKEAEAEKESTNNSYKVKIDINNLNIRKGPGKNYGTIGRFTGKGVFTIVEVCPGIGSNAGWGRLDSGDGWISLDFAKRV